MVLDMACMSVHWAGGRGRGGARRLALLASAQLSGIQSTLGSELFRCSILPLRECYEGLGDDSQPTNRVNMSEPETLYRRYTGNNHVLLVKT